MSHKIISKKVRKNLPNNIKHKLKILNDAELQYLINDILLSYQGIY